MTFTNFKAKTAAIAAALTIGFTGVATTAVSLPGASSLEAKAATTVKYKATKYVYSSDGTLNMRKSYSVKSKKVQTLKNGKKVSVTKKRSVNGTVWMYAKVNGKSGWMNSKYLVAKKKTVKKVSNSLSSTIAYGEKFLGTPYVWGGTRPSGFDCSGFTGYVYKNALGKTLPRTSGAQYASSKKISKSSLQVGDLVFFNTSGGGVSHVAIYAGNNKLLHAAGKKVKYSNLYDGYWNKRIVGYGTFR